ncbi:hypothetical protein BMS3Abin11_02491 [bacterium BMS3Abin11]|nr:hypothetical protein BMS3Abin11_02491 [bacterium BMS3Abin11]
MKIEFRMTLNLLNRIHEQLSLPHPFTSERVGFISCGVSKLPNNGLLILGETYLPVSDEDYIDSSHFGALMGSQAIRKALQFSYSNHRAMFHVHRHEHNGRPQFSSIDLRESANFIPDFWNVQPKMPHGIIVLSHDSMSGLCWHPNHVKKIPISQFSIIKQTNSNIW